jgi:hypothetical protein
MEPRKHYIYAYMYAYIYTYIHTYVNIHTLIPTCFERARQSSGNGVYATLNLSLPAGLYPYGITLTDQS